MTLHLLLSSFLFSDNVVHGQLYFEKIKSVQYRFHLLSKSKDFLLEVRKGRNYHYNKILYWETNGC